MSATVETVCERELRIAGDLDRREIVSFFVPGVPQPGGSKKAFVVAGRARIVDDAKYGGEWRSIVAYTARREIRFDPLAEPLILRIVFILPRPKAHYGTGRNANVLKASAPRVPTKKPDTTKLLRSTEDALTGIAWRDDVFVVDQLVLRRYGRKPGAYISILRF